MQYIIKLSDKAAAHMAVLTLREADLKSSAADVVLDIIGIEQPEKLVEANVLAAGHTEELKALQKLIFDHDAQGQFIREDIQFSANGKALFPDAPISTCFAPADSNGSRYMRCDLIVTNSSGGSQEKSSPAAITSSVPDQVNALARVMFLHQISSGYQIDVTKDLPELSVSIAEAEKNNWIEIDVKKAAYKLTAEGQRLYDSFIAEAQELIKRFDIYGDVDLDSAGNVRFDTGLGKDMRIAAFELEGIDPFRARFLIGINDGEWNSLGNWFDLYRDESWYQAIFEPVELAPGVEDIGKEMMQKIIDAGKTELRKEIS